MKMKCLKLNDIQHYINSITSSKGNSEFINRCSSEDKLLEHIQYCSKCCDETLIVLSDAIGDDTCLGKKFGVMVEILKGC
tara:strand:- start:192 stop:431 length:240 start_codon:yes stop_codon:yes gene_type:complete